MSDNLYGFLRRQFPAELDRPCIETTDGRTVSYAKLDRLSAKFAGALTALGVKPGDRVAAQVEKSPEALALYLGTLRAGAVYLPLNTTYTAPELGYFIEDAEPRLIVSRPEAERAAKRCAVGAGCGQVVTLDGSADGSLWEAVEEADPEFADVPRTPDDLAVILYSSGTTGRAKGAMLTIANLASNAAALKEAWRFTAADRVLHVLPISHVHGLLVAINPVLLAGGSLIFLKQFEIEPVLRLLPRATVMLGLPVMYARLLAEPRFTRELAASMRLFVAGGASLSADLHRAFDARTGHAILERYGLAEAGIVTANPYAGPRVPGSVGAPLDGVEVRIAEPETGRRLPPGEAGLIEIRSPGVFKGYWRLPETTKTDFRTDGFLITGDIGRLDAGGHLQIVGRARDLIISGGHNIYPKEVESLIDSLPGVLESAVIGVPHPEHGEGVTAVVVPAKDATLSEAEVLRPLGQRLATFKLPKRVLFVDTLPRNVMGKVQKTALRDRFKAIYKL